MLTSGALYYRKKLHDFSMGMNSNLSQMILFGGSIGIQKALQSFVNQGMFSGLLVQDAETGTVVSAVGKLSPDFKNSFPARGFEFAFLGSELSLLSRFPVVTSQGAYAGSLLASVD